jgi:beta-glucanase (GH16 family)
VVLLLPGLLERAHAQSTNDPAATETFEQVVQQMQPILWFSFGTGPGANITSLSQLAQYFDPYSSVAGKSVIHQEWERYQPFNPANFVLTTNSLNLTAAIPNGGGLWNGGINSGQIWSKQTFEPGVTGHNVYAFLARMKIPNGKGYWPAFWFYPRQRGDGSEVDVMEFAMMEWQNQFDWTGFDHGPGLNGGEIFSQLTNQWTWSPGIDFSADYYNYELVWTPDATYKYVNGSLVFASHFHWTASTPGQMAINLAVGADDPTLPGLIPVSAAEFPSALSIQYIAAWAK